jgi:hypothetical protein
MSPERSPQPSAKFEIECRGRNRLGQEVLAVPVNATVTVSLTNKSFLSLDVDCIYNTGGHGQRCKAEDPNRDKIGQGTGCVYSCDLPMH